jgi:hypothetical protein
MKLMPITALFPALPIIAFSAMLNFSAAAIADEPPPPATSPAPGNGARHHHPAFAACKRQADDQKIAPGDARREFMKSCMKAALAAPPPA